MVRGAIPVLLVAFAFASRQDADMWGPSDSVRVLDTVIAAVDKVAQNPHLSHDNIAKARHVAEDIKGDITAVESGNLTKQQAHERVGAALKELTAFQAVLSQRPADRLAALTKELDAKKAELAKDTNMMKLLNLKKQLIEKKLMLQKLLAQKAAAESAHHGEEADAGKTSAMVENLFALAKNLTGTPKAANKTAALKTALGAVRAREHEVSDALARMETKHNKSEATLDAFQAPPATGKGAAALAKGMSMIKRLRSQERHVYKKARAVKQSELKELQEVETKVEQGDVVGLKQSLGKMQREGQAMQAKAGSFLH